MSDYFQKFPVINYEFAIVGEESKQYLVTDIIRRVKISNLDIKAAGAFDIYTISEGDTPEVVSDKYYGTPFYHWLILMVNDILDGLDGFPKSQYDLEQYCIAKYGAVGMYDVHHYEDSDGHEVNALISGTSIKIYNPVTLVWELFPITDYNAITNYDYEQVLNENKRTIYLLKPIFVPTIVAEIDRLMR